jgi:hypothetical protein
MSPLETLRMPETLAGALRDISQGDETVPAPASDPPAATTETQETP